MIGWHHQINGHEFDQAVGDGETQGSLACYSPLGFKESDMIECLSMNAYVLHMFSAVSDSTTPWTVPGSSARGIFQATVLECIPFSTPQGANNHF